MKAVIIEKTGDVSVLQVKTDIPKPEIANPKDVLVEIHYSSVNSADSKTQNGFIPFLKFPYIMGTVGSGIVVEIGKDVNNVKPGDRVYGCGMGKKYAEFAIFKEIELMKIPETVSFKFASHIPIVGETFMQMACKVIPNFLELCEKNEAEGMLEGKRVLVVGASGGVGTISTLMLKHFLGAKVYAVCSKKNHEYVDSLGADKCIDYKTEKFEEVIKKDGKLDYVFDTVGGIDYSKKSCSLMDKTGKYITCGGKNFKEIINMTFFHQPWRKFCSYFKSPAWYIAFIPSDKIVPRYSKVVMDFLSKKDLLKTINCVEYSIDDVKKAHEIAETRRAVGRIALKIQ